MAILGVSDSHNASAALLRAAGVLDALQEERPARVKNFHGLPRQSIAWLLDQAGLRPADIEQVALAGMHSMRPLDRAGWIRAYRQAGTWQGRLRNAVRQTGIAALYRGMGDRRRLRALRELGFTETQITRYDHHLCHAATAYYGWGRMTEPVLVITCDGSGDGLCATISIGEHGALRRVGEVDWSHSIGTLYSVVTYMTGMVPNEHEYKLMGMAPYAAPGAARRVADRLLGLFAWDEAGRPAWRRNPGVPHTLHLQPRLEQLFREERFDAVMGGAQLFVEEMVCELVRRAVRLHGIGQVALAGGVFMNVKANKAIMDLPEVEDLYIFPSCGDETNAIGAAWLAEASLRGGHTITPLQGVYLGPDWSDAAIEAALRPAMLDGRIEVEEPDDINTAAADCLVAGEVVARFAGREEFGARSLGNRAILADPRQPAVIRQINEMIKARDFWMPFAASVLEEDAPRYLRNPLGIPAPYMILSFDTTEAGARDLAAGTHPYDQTCRPQVVSRQSNPQYWDLLQKFRQRSGVGGLLNTSLNLHGLPLVHRPEDALEVLFNSGLTRLLIGRYLVRRVVAGAELRSTVGTLVPGRSIADPVLPL
jgi:carbamoyltransferase